MNVFCFNVQQVSSASSTSPLCISVKAGTGPLNDDTLLISPTGRPIKERYYKPLPDEQLKEIDDIMAPILNKSKQKKVNMFLTLLIAIDLQTQYE